MTAWAVFKSANNFDASSCMIFTALLMTSADVEALADIELTTLHFYTSCRAHARLKWTETPSEVWVVLDLKSIQML